MATRKTTTVNIEKGSKLDQGVSAYAAETGSPYSVAMRSIAEKAIEAEDAFKRERLEAQRVERALRADIAGTEITVQQLKQSVANSLASSCALGAELDRANKEIEELREKFREEHFRAKCAQEALAEAKAELETVHAARRAEAEAEDHAAEREALEARQEDLALRQFALTLMAKRVKRALRETEEMIEDEEV
ncbi:MAG: hypothetical protein ACO32I_07105 [Candidatus Limnocylindrus sp.]